MKNDLSALDTAQVYLRNKMPFKIEKDKLPF